MHKYFKTWDNFHWSIIISVIYSEIRESMMLSREIRLKITTKAFKCFPWPLHSLMAFSAIVCGYVGPEDISKVTQVMYFLLICRGVRRDKLQSTGQIGALWWHGVVNSVVSQSKYIDWAHRLSCWIWSHLFILSWCPASMLRWTIRDFQNMDLHSAVEC